jgi:hypothetical protein
MYKASLRGWMEPVAPSPPREIYRIPFRYAERPGTLMMHSVQRFTTAVGSRTTARDCMAQAALAP